LTEFYRVGDPNNLTDVLEAGRHFKRKHGQIDRVESQTEYWLPFEAALREDLGVPGRDCAETERVQRKSAMKKRFQEAKIRVAPGARVENIKQALAFAEEAGYPLIAKPDRGVGASATFRVDNERQLRVFFQEEYKYDYFLEKFIDGEIHTFDGLTDQNGKIVFCSSLIYGMNIMEVVNSNNHVYYYTQREIPADLEEAGRQVVKLFDIRERFFHIEFFRRRSDRALLALEANIRPPGGLTVDMWNYADDIDLYVEWARILVHNSFEAKWSRKNYSLYISRKDNIRYRYTHDQLMREFGHLIVHHERMSPLFRNALGDSGYIARSPDFSALRPLIEYAQGAERHVVPRSLAEGARIMAAAHIF
jgi:hypothetical protein